MAATAAAKASTKQGGGAVATSPPMLPTITRGRSSVGIDVVRDTGPVTSDRGDDRNVTGVQKHVDQSRVHFDHVTDEADIDELPIHHDIAPLGGELRSILARDSYGEVTVCIDEPDKFALHLADEHHADNVHGFRARDAEPTRERRRDVEALEHGTDLRTAAMDNHDLNPGGMKIHHRSGEVGLKPNVCHRIAAVLDNDNFAHQVRGHVE